MKPIYLDYNATTPVDPAVLETMLPFLGSTVGSPFQHFGNPSSSHALGRKCREAVDAARSQVAQLLSAASDEILFTSGGTESNNLALKGVAMRRLPGSGGHLVISAVEHPAVVEPARFLQRLGFRLTVMGADQLGLIDPDEVEAALEPETMLVSIMHANNEIGVLQPIAEVARRCRRHGVLVHTDAAQSVGKVRVDVDELGVDLLSIAGHKIYAPKGVGALYVRRGTPLEPLLHGAGQESGLRAGTENVAYIVGLGKAASLCRETLAETGLRLGELRERLCQRLRAAIGNELTVNGEGAPRLPNTLSANFPGVVGGDLLARVPELCASTGAACHAGSTRMSATLAAIGLSPQVARGTVRLSLGRDTTADQVDRAAEWLIAAWRDSL